MTEQQIREIGSHRGSDAFSEVEKLALDYAIALSDTPAEVSDALFAELRKHLNEAQMVELTAVVAFENCLARFNRGFDVQASGFAEGAFCPIPDHATRGTA